MSETHPTCAGPGGESMTGDAVADLLSHAWVALAALVVGWIVGAVMLSDFVEEKCKQEVVEAVGAATQCTEATP